MRHLFILDPLSTLIPSDDTSLCLMRALGDRGHETWFATSTDIALREGRFQAHATRLHVGRHAMDRTSTVPVAGNRVRLWAGDFASIQMRKEPPLDTHYYDILSLLMVAARETRVMNHPAAIFTVHEKLSIYRWADAIAPTLVSSDKEEILNFVRDHRKVVLKPLGFFNSYGLNILRSTDPDLPTRIRYLLDSHGANYLHNNAPRFLMAQAFLEGISEGELRVFMLDGRILGALRKMPGAGSALTSYDYGGHVAPATLHDTERDLCLRIGADLLPLGAAFLGIDLIAGCLTEVNVTCPGMLQSYNRLNGAALEDEVADYIVGG